MDTTVSMQSEIEGVKTALEKFLKDNVDPTQSPLIALLTFTDEVTVTTFTKDLNVLLKVIKSLKAEGWRLPRSLGGGIRVSHSTCQTRRPNLVIHRGVSLFGFRGEDTQFAGVVTG
jgi:hypothetical protein